MSRLFPPNIYLVWPTVVQIQSRRSSPVTGENDLTGSLGHAAAATQGLATGVQAGAQSAAPALGEGFSALAQASAALSNAVGALTQGTVAGTSQTVGAAPKQAYLALLHLLTGGFAGALGGSLFGQ